MTSCGGGGNGGDGVGGAVQEDVTYYWKVVADDGKGGVTESDTFSFRTGL